MLAVASNLTTPYVVYTILECWGSSNIMHVVASTFITPSALFTTLMVMGASNLPTSYVVCATLAWPLCDVQHALCLHECSLLLLYASASDLARFGWPRREFKFGRIFAVQW